MTDLDLIHARANAATGGPWTSRRGSVTAPAHPDAPWNDAANVAYYGGALIGESIARREDSEFIAAARQDVPDLVSALRAVLDLHQPVDRYFLGDDSHLFATEQECRDWHDVGDTTIPVHYLSVCEHCRSIEAGMCDGGARHDYDPDATYWPCPTVRAIESALGGAR